MAGPTDTTATVIEVRDLRTRFGDAIVHDGVSLSVREGEIFALAGASGCGKSTLLREIVLLQRPESGSIRVLGREVMGLDDEQALPLRRDWGMMFERGALFSSLTVNENVGLPLREHTRLGDRLIDEIAAVKIALTGLPPSAGSKYPAELSGGMRKRAALARAIALDPKLLFLDEPTAGLDPLSAGGFEELVKHLKELLGLTILMVTHDLDLLWSVADRVAFMVSGRIAGVGHDAGALEDGRATGAGVLPGSARPCRSGASMETKVNYALVGAFVLTLSAAIVAGVLWIASGRAARKDYDTYLAYSSESVSGLNRHAPVKYKGVDVGSVREIEIDPEDPQKVLLVLAIERGVPIKQDTVAVLSVQGLTGIAFLDLEGGSKDSPLLAATEDGGYPVIATRPSLFQRLDTQVTALVAGLSEAAGNVNQLLDADTRAALQRTIRDFDSVVHEISTHSKEIDTALVGAARTMDNSARASAQLTELTRQIRQSAEVVARAAETVRATAADASGGVRQLRTDTLPELQRMLAEARAATSSLARVAQELERSPNALLVGREPLPPGPGE